MASIIELIHDAAVETKSHSRIAEKVWAHLSSKVRKRLGFTALKRLVAAELSDPDQLEFALNGEPSPIDEVPTPILAKRGYRLIKMGKSCILRGEAYVAEAKRREAKDKA